MPRYQSTTATPATDPDAKWVVAIAEHLASGTPSVEEALDCIAATLEVYDPHGPRRVPSRVSAHVRRESYRHAAYLRRRTTGDRDEGWGMSAECRS